MDKKGQSDKGRKGSEKTSRNNNRTSNKMAANTYLSIMTPNVNGIHAPIKRHNIPEWIQKQDLSTGRL